MTDGDLSVMVSGVPGTHAFVSPLLVSPLLADHGTPSLSTICTAQCTVRRCTLYSAQCSALSAQALTVLSVLYTGPVNALSGATRVPMECPLFPLISVCGRQSYCPVGPTRCLSA